MAHARHGHDLAPPAQDLGIGAALPRVLGRAREEAAEGDVVGAGLGGLDREMAAVIAGDADDAVGAEEPARLGIGRVLLADMDAVAAGGEREVGPVVHDEGDVARLRDRPQHVGGAADRVVVDILEAKLHAGDVAGIERLGEPRRRTPPDRAPAA